MALVEMYTTSLCPYCFAAKRLLTNKSVTFEEFDIWAHPTKRADMLQRSEGRTSVPQIFIDGIGIGGYDELHILAESGDLDQMLNKSGGPQT